VSVSHAEKEEWLELSTPNSAVARHVLIPRSKGKGHKIIKYAASVGMQVGMEPDQISSFQ